MEVLDGLCYSDKTGTYICMDEEPTKWEECKKWQDGEVWSQCMISCVKIVKKCGLGTLAV